MTQEEKYRMINEINAKQQEMFLNAQSVCHAVYLSINDKTNDYGVTILNLLKVWDKSKKELLASIDKLLESEVPITGIEHEAHSWTTLN